MEEKAKAMRTNAQMGAFVLKVLRECKPKLADAVCSGKDLEGWFDRHRRRGDTLSGGGADFDAAAHAVAIQKKKEAEAAKAAEAFSRTKRRQKRPKHDTVEVSTQTGSGVGGGEDKTGRRIDEGRRSNEYSSDEDYSRGEKSRRPLSSSSKRSSPIRPSDGRRRRERPSSAVSGRRKSPMSLRKSFNRKGGKSNASLFSAVKKISNLKNTNGVQPKDIVVRNETLERE